MTSSNSANWTAKLLDILNSASPSGVETTTGPLGQGRGNSVGMAIAGQWLAARYNKPEFKVFDYNVYVICSDGDMMEGIGSEAASLAGHLKLSNLCWLYDNNNVTLDGPADWSYGEDTERASNLMDGMLFT